MFETLKLVRLFFIRVGGGCSFEPISVNIESWCHAKAKEVYGVQVEIESWEKPPDDKLKKLEERLG